MGIKYSHLNSDERAIMESFFRLGVTKAAVARYLDRHRSTITRECARAARPALTSYIAHFGQLAYARGRKRAGRARRKFGPDLSTPIWQRVLSDLREGFSPEQSAGRMRYLDELFTPSMPRSHLYASHETVYKAIADLPHSPQRAELTRLLRHSTGGRRRRRASSRHTGLRNTTPLDLRPAEAASRRVIGHWEGDLIKGAGNKSAVGTLVERASRLTLLVPLRSASATDVYEGFRRALGSLPKAARKSLTYDRGSEMALHDTLSKALDMPIFFCPPYSPGSRGTNENTNGLLRQYMPKGTDLSLHTADELAAIQRKLNRRPRRVLGFRNPLEAFDQLLRAAVAAAA
jgi:transposase, IS30 family